MFEQLLRRGFAERAEAQQAGVVAVPRRQFRLLHGLCGGAADARHLDEVRSAKLIRREREHRLEQPELRIANGELRRMHADRHAARTGSFVITRQRALAALVELARGRQRQRMRRNHQTSQQFLAQRFQNCPSLTSKCVGLSQTGPPRPIQAASHSIIWSAVTSGRPKIP